MKWVLLSLQTRSNNYPRNGRKIITGMLQNLLVFSKRITKVSRTSLNESMITYVKLAQRKSIMNDLITIMKFSIRCTVFRVINHNFSIVTNEKEIRKSIQMQFRTQVGYVIINNLKPAFWKIFSNHVVHI